MNIGDDLLDPAMRRWVLSEATPRVWAAAFVANIDGGQQSALLAADAAAILVEQIRHAPPRQLESIAAQSGIVIEEPDFAGWFRVCDALRNSKTSEYRVPSEQ